MTQEQQPVSREQAKLQATIDNLCKQRDNAQNEAASIAGELSVTVMERDGFAQAAKKLADAIRADKGFDDVADVLKMFEDKQEA